MEDTFRIQTNELDKWNVEKIMKIKELADELLAVMVHRNEEPFVERQSRELALAKTKLEEAVMWAVKHWSA